MKRALMFWHLLTRQTIAGISVPLLVVIVFAATFGAAAGAEAVLLGTSQPGASTSPTAAFSTPTAMRLLTPTATRAPVPVHILGQPTATPLPTFPPATPTPTLYSVHVVSKVYGVNGHWVQFNVQAWPPDPSHFMNYRATYSVCPAVPTATVAQGSTWNDYGIGEVDLDIGSCYQQGNTLTLALTMYWSTGQEGQLQATLPIQY